MSSQSNKQKLLYHSLPNTLYIDCPSPYHFSLNESELAKFSYIPPNKRISRLAVFKCLSINFCHQIQSLEAGNFSFFILYQYDLLYNNSVAESEKNNDPEQGFEIRRRRRSPKNQQIISWVISTFEKNKSASCYL